MSCDPDGHGTTFIQRRNWVKKNAKPAGSFLTGFVMSGQVGRMPPIADLIFYSQEAGGVNPWGKVSQHEKRTHKSPPAESLTGSSLGRCDPDGHVYIINKMDFSVNILASNNGSSYSADMAIFFRKRPSPSKPWDLLGMTRSEYEAIRPWKTAGVSRARFEEVTALVPAEIVAKIKQEAEADLWAEELFGEGMLRE